MRGAAGDFGSGGFALILRLVAEAVSQGEVLWTAVGFREPYRSRA